MFILAALGVVVAVAWVYVAFRAATGHAAIEMATMMETEPRGLWDFALLPIVGGTAARRGRSLPSLAHRVGRAGSADEGESKGVVVGLEGRASNQKGEDVITGQVQVSLTPAP